MKLYTYHDYVPEHNAFDELMLIQIWRKHWDAVGFEPFVLSEWHARRHPYYDTLMEAVEKLPSQNPKRYEIACFIRWLALAQVGGGWMSDYDVFPNVGKLETNEIVFSRTLNILQNRGVSPSLVCCNPEYALKLSQVFVEGKLGRRQINGKEHVSDQYIIEDLVLSGTDWIRLHDVVRCYGDEDWQKARVIHFANASMNGRRPRWKHIPQLLNAGAEAQPPAKSK